MPPRPLQSPTAPRGPGQVLSFPFRDPPPKVARFPPGLSSRPLPRETAHPSPRAVKGWDAFRKHTPFSGQTHRRRPAKREKRTRLQFSTQSPVLPPDGKRDKAPRPGRRPASGSASSQAPPPSKPSADPALPFKLTQHGAGLRCACVALGGWG